MAIAEPHKELRFTRAAQAVPFWIAAAVGVGVAVILFSVSFNRHIDPSLPHASWAILPLVVAWFCVRIAIHCTKHAYLILSPLGIEIFPLVRPAAGMRMVHWSEIADAEIDGRSLTLHFDTDRTGGVRISLVPIARNKRPLLAKAIEGRLEG